MVLYVCYATPKLIKHLNGFILSKFQISHYQRINTGCGSCYQVHISLRLLYRYQTTSSTLHSSRRWHRFNGIISSNTKMSSSLSIRGSRKLRPRSRSRSRSCRRQASHLIRNEENHPHHHYHEYNDYTPIHAMQLSPSPSPSPKTKTKMVMVMMVDTGSSRGSNDGCDNDDDLFFGYPSTPVRRIVGERDNTRQLEQYSSSSPAGSTTRSFKIESLDGCCEEVVSPLFPESSLQPLHYGDNIPMITSVASFAEDEDNNEYDNENEDSLTFSPTTITGRHGNRMDTNITWDNNIDSDELIWMCRGNDYTIPSSSSNNHNHNHNHKRRSSGHNRSQFVLDGSFSFDSVPSPSPVHTSPSTITVATSNDPVCYSSPIIQTGTRTSMMIPPSVMITPPQHLLLSYDDEGLQRTLPPTHAEQRRRNKAMPSMQYENLILNRLRQQQQQQQQQMR